jgi:spermidine synthase
MLASGVAVSLVLVVAVPSTPWGLAAYGRYFATYGTRLAAGIRPEVPPVPPDPVADIRCTYLGEGLNGSIAVTLTTTGIRSFHSAGKVQASSDFQDMRLQRMLGHLSALVHGKPESVLVVACGAGVTAGSFVPHPETRRIVICDIEPLVPRVVAPMFARENFNVIADPRTQVVSDDGRHFIRTTHETFDVITSDPIDPWVKGCAALNTVEYYKMCRDHLRPGGVMSLWVPLYESDRETVRTLMASFFEVFPNATLWSNDNQGQGYDTVLLGQVEPTRLDLTALEARLERTDRLAVRRSMREAGFASLSELLGTYAGQARDLTEWSRGAVLNTDRNLRLQYLAGWSVNSFSSGSILNEILSYRRYPESIFIGSEPHRRRIMASWDNNSARSSP